MAVSIFLLLILAVSGVSGKLHASFLFLPLRDLWEVQVSKNDLMFSFSSLFFSWSIFLSEDAAWCVCRSDMSTTALQKTLDYACGAGADCTPILQNGACYNPNTVLAHCSYAANSYYQGKGQTQDACNFAGTAMLTSTDPGNQSLLLMFLVMDRSVGDSTHVFFGLLQEEMVAPILRVPDAWICRSVDFFLHLKPVVHHCVSLHQCCRVFNKHKHHSKLDHHYWNHRDRRSPGRTRPRRNKYL
ncbi:hypothetical protein B296_00030840 [Ensete ventricosum]|uniref:X8 domain-containing protein n=1 Tax=Ensete ventricosum TaxID=4639 RepID=A0A427AAX9_ENSVE|nr:hypothetical protein B296_00030840 [Ensete ventricosum]